MTEKREEWKEVEGFNGRLLISSHGRCISTFTYGNPFSGSKILPNGKRVPLKNGRKVIKEVRELKPNAYKMKSGVVHGPSIQIRHNQKNVNMPLGQLVAKHFLDNPLNRKKARYKDGDVTNCRVENLEWAGGNIKNKQEYIERLRNMDVGERKSEDVIDAIIKYLEGDKSSMDRILGKYRHTIWRAIYKKVQPDVELTNDLTQDSLIKIYQKIDDLMFHTPKNPVGWFVRIAQNITRNYENKKRMISKTFRTVEYLPASLHHNSKLTRNGANRRYRGITARSDG